MLEVKLDRQVEISNIADKQWRTRNVPGIKDMTVALEAWQDMDMVRFDITLTFPHPSKRRAAKRGLSWTSRQWMPQKRRRREAARHRA